jgi:DNA-binding MarR family transcriptional regulator
MSARASAYAKTLIVCPNGERISRGEKLVLITLADSHQDKAKHFTYPSVETIGEDALCDRRSCQRHLAALERKGVIQRLRPPNQGRGMQVFYFFTALDAIPEGWQNAALFGADDFAQKGGRRAAEGRQKGDKSCSPSITNTNCNEELKATPPNPLASEGELDLKETSDESTRETSAADLADELRHTSAVVGRDEAAQSVCGNGREVDSRGRSGFAAASGDYAIDRAIEQLANALSIADRRLLRKLRRVIELEAEKGEPPATIALDMIAAWREQERLGHLLKCKYGMTKFFLQGIWKRKDQWHWNEELLRQRAQASVGSWG